MLLLTKYDECAIMCLLQMQVREKRIVWNPYEDEAAQNKTVHRKGYGSSRLNLKAQLAIS